MPESGTPFQIAGALVKAVLLAGASHLQGNVENQNDQYGGLPLEEAPSGKQGFGRVDLSQALPLQGSGKNWRMQVNLPGRVTAMLAAFKRKEEKALHRTEATHFMDRYPNFCKGSESSTEFGEPKLFSG